MLIAEDHAILRKGLRQIVEGETGLKVIAEAEDGIQALELTRTCRPHVAVLDVDMPGKDGLTVAREVGLLRLDVALIPLTAGRHTPDHGNPSARAGDTR